MAMDFGKLEARVVAHQMSPRQYGKTRLLSALYGRRLEVGPLEEVGSVSEDIYKRMAEEIKKRQEKMAWDALRGYCEGDVRQTLPNCRCTIEPVIPLATVGAEDELTVL